MLDTYDQRWKCALKVGTSTFPSVQNFSQWFVKWSLKSENGGLVLIAQFTEEYGSEVPEKWSLTSINGSNLENNGEVLIK